GCDVRFADRIEQRSLAVIHVTHDRDYRSTWYLDEVGLFRIENFFDCLVLELFFIADHGCGCPEFRGHILHHLSVERLVDRDEDAAHQQNRDQVLRADLKLLRKVLHADAFRHRDLTRNWKRLVAEVGCATKTWRWHKALHWAFLRLRILLASTARASRSTLRTRSFTRRWNGSGTARSWSTESSRTRSSKPRPLAKSRTSARSARACKAGACRMLRSWAACKLPWCSWNALLVCPRSAGRSTVEDWFSALDASALRSRRRYAGDSHWRRLVNRTRPCLRHHDPPRCWRGRRCRGLCCLYLWRAGSGRSRCDRLFWSFLHRRDRHSRRLRSRCGCSCRYNLRSFGGDRYRG